MDVFVALVEEFVDKAAGASARAWFDAAASTTPALGAVAACDGGDNMRVSSLLTLESAAVVESRRAPDVLLPAGVG